VARPILARYACVGVDSHANYHLGFAAATRSVNRHEACARCGAVPPAEESRRISQGINKFVRSPVHIDDPAHKPYAVAVVGVLAPCTVLKG